MFNLIKEQYVCIRHFKLVRDKTLDNKIDLQENFIKNIDNKKNQGIIEIY